MTDTAFHIRDVAQDTSRRGFLRGISSVAALVGVGSFLAACDAQGTPEQAPGTAVAQLGPAVVGGNLRVAFGETNSGAFNLDPATSKRLYESLSALYGYLVRYGPKYNLVGDLATSWTSNAAATQWTFTLRPGVRFHNGQPFTADDVVYTFQRALDPATGSTALSLLAPVLDSARASPGRTATRRCSTSRRRTARSRGVSTA